MSRGTTSSASSLAGVAGAAGPAEELGAGRRLGRYELLTPIGEGGMGRVWAARMEGTRGFRKIVAIKALSSTAVNDPKFEQMLFSEAHLASQIRHRHVVEILDLGEEQGVVFIVMEWVDGESLHRLVHGGGRGDPLPPEIAARIVADAASGLHAAHELCDEQGRHVGLVHRDVSPQNILIARDGTVKVVDFGIAKALGLASGATRTRELKGKISYMAPELVRSQPLDRRSDVFSLGVVLFEVLAGQRPFVADHEVAILQLIAFGDAPRLSTQVPDCPPELEDIVANALARDPADRFQTAEQLSLALEQYLSRSGQVVTSAHLAAAALDRCGAEMDAVRRRITSASTPSADAPARASTPEIAAAPDAPAAAISSPAADVRPAAPVFGPAPAFAPPAPIAAAPASAPLPARSPALSWIVAIAVFAVAAIAGIAALALTRSTPAPPVIASAAPGGEGAPILLRVKPAGAVVRVAGATVGAGDQRIARPSAGARTAVEVRLDGYEAKTLEIGADAPAAIDVDLVPTIAPSVATASVAQVPSAARPASSNRGKGKVAVPANPY
jgi:eukaryotic-like serine/threonine-protein kinase